MQLLDRILSSTDPLLEPLTERVVFGLSSPALVAEEIAGWCQAVLGADIVDAWLWSVSVGCVAGVTLADGCRVVIKAAPPDRSRDRVDQTLDAQRAAATAGFPAPSPRSGAARLGLGWGHAEEALIVGRRPDLRDSVERATAARAWTALTDVLADTVDPAAWASLPRVRDGLYPQPHSPLFDFDATSGGAGWIDDLARHALGIMDLVDTRPQIVHTDWRPDNLRVSFDGTTVAAIYDWDSLQLEVEPIALGTVAAMHTVDFSTPGGPHFPTAEQCLNFAADAASARRRPFTDVEWRAVRAAIVYGWCYTARCEHARASVDDDRPFFGMRARLSSDGRQLLASVSPRSSP